MYLRQPVAVEDGSIEALLLVDVGEVFEGHHVNVLISPPPLLILHQSGRHKTFIPLLTKDSSFLSTIFYLMYYVVHSVCRYSTYSYLLIFIFSHPVDFFAASTPDFLSWADTKKSTLPHPPSSPVLEEAQGFVGPDADEALHREGLQGPQGLEDAPHPAGHLSGGVDVVGLGVLGEAFLQK